MLSDKAKQVLGVSCVGAMLLGVGGFVAATHEPEDGRTMPKTYASVKGDTWMAEATEADGKRSNPDVRGVDPLDEYEKISRLAEREVEAGGIGGAWRGDSRSCKIPRASASS